jgi:aspartate-semialdehyde dehydrogenase
MGLEESDKPKFKYVATFEEDNDKIKKTYFGASGFKDFTIYSKELSKEDIFNELSKFDGIKIINDEENNSFPEPVFTSGKPDIYVGRIRPEFTINGNDNSNWSFFVSGDQLLKGAAYNSVQILKKMNKTKSNISSSKKHL